MQASASRPGFRGIFLTTAIPVVPTWPFATLARPSAAFVGALARAAGNAGLPGGRLHRFALVVLRVGHNETLHAFSAALGAQVVKASQRKVQHAALA